MYMNYSSWALSMFNFSGSASNAEDQDEIEIETGTSYDCAIVPIAQPTQSPDLESRPFA
jgi:hypothetical protein